MRFSRTVGVLATVAAGVAVLAGTVSAGGSALKGTITADGSTPALGVLDQVVARLAPRADAAGHT